MNTTSTGSDLPAQTESSNESRSRSSKLSRFWFALRLLEVRLRFIGILVLIGLVIGYWDTLKNYWDRATRPAVTTAANTGSDTEFYCPMDPSVVRDSLEPNGSIPKCPICGMPLSTRKKGAPMVLPPGVVGRVSLTPERTRMAGIRTEAAAVRPMNRQIRTVGVVAYNQANQSQIVSRVGGYLENLFVDKTFAYVNKGDKLAEIYSPELFAAVQELKIAAAGSNQSLLQGSREKIRLLGVEDQEIDAILASKETGQLVVVRSPVRGFVIRKDVQQGASVAAGQRLFEIADLSSVWIEADIFERDISLLREGQEIIASFEAYPDGKFKGTVALIYPELQASTRTNRVRFEVENPDLLLRTGMFATITLQTPLQESEPFATMLAQRQNPPGDQQNAIVQQAICPVTGAPLGSMGDPVPVSIKDRRVYLCCSGCTDAIMKNPDHYLARIDTVTENGVLAVPESAVVDTGDQKIVYVERDEGLFEGIEVTVGPRADGYYSVIRGLFPGDRVAAAGAFLIDAETRLNPAASAAYFGASGGNANGGATQPAQPSTSGQPSSSEKTTTREPGGKPEILTPDELAEISKLVEPDQSLAKAQVLCPVTKLHLGSMGVPFKVELNGTSVFLCCEGCLTEAQANPAETVKLVDEWRAANNNRDPSTDRAGDSP